jgi:hypothetical protein
LLWGFLFAIFSSFSFALAKHKASFFEVEGGSPVANPSSTTKESAYRGKYGTRLRGHFSLLSTLLCPSLELSVTSFNPLIGG